MHRIILLAALGLVGLAGCTDTDAAKNDVKELVDHCPGDVSVTYKLSGFSNTITVSCSKVNKVWVSSPHPD